MRSESLELRTRMEMIEKIAGLAPEKQDAMLRLVKGIWGEPDEAGESRWLRILEGAMPLLNMAAMAIMSRLGAPPAPTTQPGVAPLAGQLAAPVTPQTPQPADMLLAQIYQLIGLGIQQGQSSNPVLAMMDDLFQSFPNSAAAQQCRLILERPSAEVVAQLGLTHPDSERWVGALQLAWKTETEESNQPEVLTFGTENG